MRTGQIGRPRGRGRRSAASPPAAGSSSPESSSESSSSPDSVRQAANGRITEFPEQLAQSGLALLGGSAPVLLASGNDRVTTRSTGGELATSAGEVGDGKHAFAAVAAPTLIWIGRVVGSPWWLALALAKARGDGRAVGCEALGLATKPVMGLLRLLFFFFFFLVVAVVSSSSLRGWRPSRTGGGGCDGRNGCAAGRSCRPFATFRARHGETSRQRAASRHVKAREQANVRRCSSKTRFMQPHAALLPS